MQKSKVFYILLFLVIFSSAPIFANKLEGHIYVAEFESSVTFYKDTLEYITRFKSKKYTYNYTLQCDHKVPYLSLNNGEEKWLILYSDKLLLLYNSKSDRPFFRGVGKDSGIYLELIISLDKIEATSSLIEQGQEYPPSNLYWDFLGKPWVEGVPGNGIGEKLFIPAVAVKNIFISNGYIDFLRPDLYEKNSRLKKIKIIDTENDTEFIKELDDTPCPQRIEFKDNKDRQIEIEILEVYKGTKYKDTCVNFIVFNLGK